MNNQIEEILRNKFCLFRKDNASIEIYKEVPVYSRSVDLVEYNTKTKELTAIEFKINDWKRALQQLNCITMCFDYLVLCIPKPKTQKCILNIYEACKRNGIGLYLWDKENDVFTHDCIEINTKNIWEIQKQNIIKYLKIQEDKDE